MFLTKIPTTLSIRKPFVFLLLILTISCKEKTNTTTNQGNLTINTFIKNLDKGTLYFNKLKGDSLIVIDSINVLGSQPVKTSFDIEEPEVLYLTLDRGQTKSIDNAIAFFAEPGLMTINTTLKHFYSDAKIEGSENQNVWDKFKKINTKFNDQKVVLLAEQIRNKTKGYNQSNKNISKKIEKIKQKQLLHLINFAINHSDFEISAWLLLNETILHNQPIIKKADSAFSQKVKDSKYGKLLYKAIYKQTS